MYNWRGLDNSQRATSLSVSWDSQNFTASCMSYPFSLEKNGTAPKTFIPREVCSVQWTLQVTTVKSRWRRNDLSLLDYRMYFATSVLSFKTEAEKIISLPTVLHLSLHFFSVLQHLHFAFSFKFQFLEFQHDTLQMVLLEKVSSGIPLQRAIWRFDSNPFYRLRNKKESTNNGIVFKSDF